MRFRALVLSSLAVMIFLLHACAQGTTSHLPTIPDPQSSPASQAGSAEPLHAGHNLLGYWEITVNAESGAIQAVPVRLAEVHLNVLSWLEVDPCTDCLQITNLEILPSNDLEVEITLRHPFTNPLVTGFDVRGICMLDGDLDFPGFGVNAPCLLEGNPELINADGHTTLYNPTTEGNEFRGYIKGKMAPDFPIPTATLNGFKTYFSSTDRRYFQAGDSLAATFLIRPSAPAFTFGYAVDASWARPSTPIVIPDSFPITANSLEAYRIEAQLSNPLPVAAGSAATLTIDVYDWQGEGTIDTAHVEAPYFRSGLIEATSEPGGPGTKRFTCELLNEYGTVGEGEFPVLIRVLDSASQPGDLIDNIAWLIFQVPTTENEPPTCAAEVSNPEPDPGEVITFTDTSTDPNGPEDLDISSWDWDNDGVWDEDGTEVTHSWDTPGVYRINHRIIDKAGAEDELDEPITLDVGLYVTLREDFDSKGIGAEYHYISMDNTYDSGAIIDVEDTDGPWDFTTIGLSDLTNVVAIVDDGDAEISGFVNDFNSDTTHFIKCTDIFDPFFPLLYQAEYHDFSGDQLYIYGFHDPYVIDSSPFGPPDTEEYLVIPYPLSASTSYEFVIDNPGFYLIYDVTTMGEGVVIVPYDGGTTYHCLMVRYKFRVISTEPVLGGTLSFAFITDSGMTVANVIAVNDPPIYNWNHTTNRINADGMTLFQALDHIE